MPIFVPQPIAAPIRAASAHLGLAQRRRQSRVPRSAREPGWGANHRTQSASLGEVSSPLWPLGSPTRSCGPVRSEMPRQRASSVSRRITVSKSGSIRLSISFTWKPACNSGDARASMHNGAPEGRPVVWWVEQHDFVLHGQLTCAAGSNRFASTAGLAATFRRFNCSFAHSSAGKE